MSAARHLSFLHHASAKWGCLCGSLGSGGAKHLASVTCPECLVVADQLADLQGLEVLSIGTRVLPRMFPTAPPPGALRSWLVAVDLANGVDHSA